MAGLEGAKVRASGTRHTTNPWLWGIDSSLHPHPGHNLEYVISLVPQEGNSIIALAVQRDQFYFNNKMFYSDSLLTNKCVLGCCVIFVFFIT